MKKILLLFLTIGVLTSCSSDDDNSSEDNTTSAKITLQNSNGDPQSGIIVYAYNETTWQVIGDDPFFADFQVASGNNGNAKFSNLTTDATFSELNNFTQTYRFSVHYTLNGTDKTKVKAISFNLGDHKSETIILD